MARERKVTRTIRTTVVTAKIYDLSAELVENRYYILAGVLSDEKDMFKAIEKMDKVKCLVVISTEVEETLYGMSEDKFIEYAEILPARTKKNN